jgi:hypothetical protein
MSNNRITPFVKRMRTSGGTIYVFSSAAEDIGLNINEKNNDVRISHFALLDIPRIQYPTNINENRFNLYAIDGALEYANAGDIKDGRVLIAESFQNYALNLESNLLNQPTYDATLQRTVSERVFWKWLKETGAIRWADPSNGYWMEAPDPDGSLGYNTVVKYVGLVSAGNVRSDSFGTYNETYIMVPTSHGQMEAYFEQTEDTNYKHGMEIGNLGENILGRENWLQPHPDGLSYKAYYDFVDSSIQVGSYPYYLYYDASPGWWFTAEGREPLQENTYMTDTSAYLTTGIYDVSLKIVGPTTVEFKRSLVDCMGLVLDLNKLKTIYGDPNLTFDSMATGDNAINDRFEFNAVLVYYSVYNAVQDTVLATNLLGILFLDAPSGTSQLISGDGILIPSLEKIQSTTGGFGTSYALRLNIKTDNMLDDTGAIIVDDATSDIFEAENWNLAFAELGKAVNILTRNNSVLNYISDQYVTLQSNQTQMLNSLTALQAQVNDIAVDIQGTENAIAMFSAGDDPLVESSIYMKSGKVGIFNANPDFPFQVDASSKMKDIYINKAIRDVSGNVILSYGSPLQLGSSTNYREIALYTGGLTPALTIDTSNKVSIPSFTSPSVVLNSSIGTGLAWGPAGTLDVSIIVTGVSQSYVDGSLLSRDAQLTIHDISIGDLYVTKQNTIADGTYLKESSIGSGLVWNGTLLDVSVAGGSGVSQAQFDSSIAQLTNWNQIQDGSIGTSVSSITWGTNDGVISYTTNNGGGASLNSLDLRYQIKNYPEPSANMTSITYRGQTIDLVAGTTINSMYLAMPAATGRMQLADADSSSLVPAIAINPSTGNYTAGNTYPFLLEGIIRNSAWTWTPGKQLYLSASNQLTQTAPSIATHCVQVLGVALAKDIIYFNPSMDFIVVK